MKVRYAPLALADLEDIYRAIAAHNPIAVARVIERIKTSIGFLEDFPGLGRPSEIKGARKLGVPRIPYIIVYEIDAASEEAVILRVYHGARDMPY